MLVSRVRENSRGRDFVLTSYYRIIYCSLELPTVASRVGLRFCLRPYSVGVWLQNTVTGGMRFMSGRVTRRGSVRSSRQNSKKPFCPFIAPEAGGLIAGKRCRCHSFQVMFFVVSTPLAARRCCPLPGRLTLSASVINPRPWKRRNWRPSGSLSILLRPSNRISPPGQRKSSRDARWTV